MQRPNLRNDLAADANRLPNCVGKLVPAGFDDLAKHLVRKPSIVTKRLGDLTEILVQGDLVRLPVVPGLDSGQRLAVLLDQVGEAAQQLSTVGGGQIPPRGVAQGTPSSADGAVDILSRRCVD